MPTVIAQALRFGLVGAAATLLHVLLAVGLVEAAALSPLSANLAAFCAALAVSYLGNLRWTFALRGAHRTRFPRFATIALLGLLLNQTIVYGFVELLHLDYRAALAVVVLIVPGASFLAHECIACPGVDEDLRAGRGEAAPLAQRFQDRFGSQ